MGRCGDVFQAGIPEAGVGLFRKSSAAAGPVALAKDPEGFGIFLAPARGNLVGILKAFGKGKVG